MHDDTKHVDILDTTLRDGSYTIEYQFSAEETSLIAHGLELAGVRYVEIGHGLGLGAARSGKGAQAASDISYMQSCAGSVTRAAFGFFYIPGIGQFSDLELLRRESGSFVRIGVAPESEEDALSAIQLASGLGLEVWANVMKTYAYPAEEIGKLACRLAAAGATGVYVVDSAGGMLPGTVATFVKTIQRALISEGLACRVGFHGHDNLSLATACSLASVEAGCDIVDGSLMGIGRSIGNAATEILAMVLDRAGYVTGVDPWYSADLAERMIQPFLQQRWRHSSLEQALGYAQIHSGFLPLLERVAAEKHVNLRELVLGLPPSSARHIEAVDVQGVADRIANKSSFSGSADHGVTTIATPAAARGAEIGVGNYLDQIRSEALRMSRPSALVVTGPWSSNGALQLQQVRVSPHLVVGAVEVKEAGQLKAIAETADGVIDYIFIDQTARDENWTLAASQALQETAKSNVLPYSDEISCLIGVCHQVAVRVGASNAERIAILGICERAGWLTRLLPNWGIQVGDDQDATMLIVAGKVDVCRIESAKNVKAVFDLMTGVIDRALAESLLARGVELIRLDGRGALLGEVSGLYDASSAMSSTLGRSEIGGIRVVAGGAWGLSGDVVVDRIRNPSRAIGVADGFGQLKPAKAMSQDDAAALESVRRAIASSILVRSAST